MTSDLIDLRRLAQIAKSSELHDLKIGLTPDECDSIADALEAAQAEMERLDGDNYIQAGMIAELQTENERLREGLKDIAEISPEDTRAYIAVDIARETLAATGEKVVRKVPCEKWPDSEIEYGSATGEDDD